MSSPPADRINALDLKGLAKSTAKTFNRLVPFSQLQHPSSPGDQRIVDRVVLKVKSYLEAIDMTIQLVYNAYQMSKLASTLWDDALLRNRISSASDEHQKRMEHLVMIADEAHQKAQKMNNVLREVEQDFYRIAARTKEATGTVNIPVDPALPNVMKKLVRDIGLDLVANLSLLADFSRQASDLTAWCGWIRDGIIATNGTVVPPQYSEEIVDADAIHVQWAKVRADCIIYHGLIADLQHRYPTMLPTSTQLWQEAMAQADASNTSDTKPTTQAKQARGVAQRLSDLFRDAFLQLGTHVYA
ncbi:hypothetical protein DXG03_002348 [Asterophora parasitica]|uniref:Uncharacterized protein n=1 Tax=Asterophora parasitica TaxID=117018 RepID=A0A9P7G4E8_9AGAR|nr:hypothetical protein DXG03_002348 [Asterophora parasitica]